METQPLRATLAAAALAFSLVLAPGGCAGVAPGRPAYRLIATGVPDSAVRLYRSDHFVLYTTLADDARVADLVATLERGFDAYVGVTGVRPAAGAAAMNVFVFARRAEWESFTRSRTGDDAGLYLKLDRGGYAHGRFAALREQGERDTRTVLAHEGFHLFVATHFTARPPPFVEEGIATLFETVRADDGVATIDVAQSAGRLARLAAVGEAGALVPLRTLLSMHAGDVIGMAGTDVDAFYAQAWAFARFLREGDGGAHRAAFERMLADAASGALSSDNIADGPALVERYVGVPLATLDVAYRRFAVKLAGRVAAQ